jgi:hypothetical protein
MMTKTYYEVFVTYPEEEHYLSAMYFSGFRAASGWLDLTENENE